MNIVFMLLMILALLTMLFMMVSMKMSYEKMKSASFECGFSSYFYSRYSFSIHYFMVGIIFLFLDLEICMIMPMLTEMESSTKMKYNTLKFVTILILGLIAEWASEKLEWKN